MYYCQSRYYDPEIGRWLNADRLVTTDQGITGYNLFAYCVNNPINSNDPSGTIRRNLIGRSVDSIFFGNDSAGAGGGITLAGAGIISALVTAITHVGTEMLRFTQTGLQQIAHKISETIELTAQREPQYQYWEAWRAKNNVIVGRGLTFAEASVRVACGLDIMCANEGAARWLVIINGYWNSVGPEIHGDDGYYYHYHPNRNSHTHIWFY